MFTLRSIWREAALMTPRGHYVSISVTTGKKSTFAHDDEPLWFGHPCGWGGFMKSLDRIAVRLTGGGLTFALLISSCAVALPAPQEPSPARESQQAPPANRPNQETQTPAPGVESLPDSPGAGQYHAVIAQAEPQTGPAQPAPQPPPAKVQKPVGTAAAETTTTTGFAVSRPAGAALAPAKQKRSRTILISVGAVVGAAVALGTVAALSKGTPSKPPGAQ